MWHWLYARVGADADLYARMMKYAMARSLADLSARYPAMIAPPPPPPLPPAQMPEPPPSTPAPAPAN
jgi:hypothetical protein